MGFKGTREREILLEEREQYFSLCTPNVFHWKYSVFPNEMQMNFLGLTYTNNNNSRLGCNIEVEINISPKYDSNVHKIAMKNISSASQ